MYHPSTECVVVTMKLCSIFCVVAPSLHRQYKERHDVVGWVIHWEVCKEYGVKCSDKWYEHSPKSVEENEEVKLLWDFTIQIDREIHHRRPDIVIQKKKAKETIIVDIAVRGDTVVMYCRKKLKSMKSTKTWQERLKGSGNQGQKWCQWL